jgi:hypothetical protein
MEDLEMTGFLSKAVQFLSTHGKPKVRMNGIYYTVTQYPPLREVVDVKGQVLSLTCGHRVKRTFDKAPKMTFCDVCPKEAIRTAQDEVLARTTLRMVQLEAQAEGRSFELCE